MAQDISSTYRDRSASVRRNFAGESGEARRYYTKYVAFVTSVAPSEQGKELLDVGCGNGWSAAFLSEKGFRVTGADLDASAFEPEPSEKLVFHEASALELGFPGESFDIVTSYQMLEHIPEPEKALGEMLRVLRPGGVLVVAGPNLTSLGNSLRAVVGAFRQRPLHRILVRDRKMRRSPFGGTLPEALGVLAVNVWRNLTKLISADAHFTMREPDLRPPFRGDSDACYLMNPVDLEKFLVARGGVIIARSAPGRPDWTRSLAGGTWVAFRKGGA